MMMASDPDLLLFNSYYLPSAFEEWLLYGVTETYERMDAEWQLHFTSFDNIRYWPLSDNHVSYSDFVGQNGFARLVREVGLDGLTLGTILSGMAAALNGVYETDGTYYLTEEDFLYAMSFVNTSFSENDLSTWFNEVRQSWSMSVPGQEGAVEGAVDNAIFSEWWNNVA